VRELDAPELRQYLTSIDPVWDHWEKRSTPVYDQTGPRPFEVHYYWNTTSSHAEYGRGFKVRFAFEFYPGG
jgi:hypothetical protein